MSLEDAKKFIIDFRCNPNLAISLLKISLNDLKKNNEIIVNFAKKKGYSLTLSELKKVKFENKKLSMNQLDNVFGGADVELSVLNKANANLKLICEILNL